MKRVMDFVLAGILLVVLEPLMAAVALAIWVTMGRPILFRQLRPGYLGEPFELVKFRSMDERTGLDGRPLPGKQRITRLGYFLRRTSIDELPELWNVLKGDMSFVGPRPLRIEYLQRYSTEQARRHEVRPGLTGLAQVNGRQLLGWEDRFKLDVWYVDNQSLWLDLRILAATFLQVIVARGHSASANDDEFIGSRRAEYE